MKAYGIPYGPDEEDDEGDLGDPDEDGNEC
jgi:hypothetical protein